MTATLTVDLLPLIQDRAARLAAEMRADRVTPRWTDAVEGIAADLAAITAHKTPDVDPAEVRRLVARRLIAVHRHRRAVHESRGQHALLLTLWVAWEQARDEFARDVADAVANGWHASLPVYAAAYTIARERTNAARVRYSAAYQAAKAAKAAGVSR